MTNDEFFKQWKEYDDYIHSTFNYSLHAWTSYRYNWVAPYVHFLDLFVGMEWEEIDELH